MKKILSIILLLVFVYNIAGFFVIFKLQQYSAEKAMKTFIRKNMSNAGLEKVVVPNAEITSGSSDFRFQDDNEEFFYKGKLYDIVRTTNDGNSTVFYCINDKNEERVYAMFNEHIQQNTDQNVPIRSNTATLVKGMIKDAIPHLPTDMIVSSSMRIVFGEMHFCLLQQFIPVYSPPPEG
jgi:hypothetical protein